MGIIPLPATGSRLVSKPQKSGQKCFRPKGSYPAERGGSREAVEAWRAGVGGAPQQVVSRDVMSRRQAALHGPFIQILFYKPLLYIICV